MRCGHFISTGIPDDPNEAEFPPLPWGDRVLIRVKSQAPPVQPLAPLPADGESPSSSPAPGLPAIWTGPAFGQAPPISADAAALANYTSRYRTRAVDKDPDDPKLLRLRGVSCSDGDIHALNSWTTRKDHPTWIGISLPIKDWVGGDYHEIQVWEDPAEPIQIAHTAVGVYDWLTNRMRSRGCMPTGMPVVFEDLPTV
jgi:hypothetical protein